MTASMAALGVLILAPVDLFTELKWEGTTYMGYLGI